MRHHGGVASTCIHGFAPGTCLICQTLQGGSATATRTPERPAAKRSRGREPAGAVATAGPVRPDAVITGRPRRSGSVGAKAVGFLVLALLVVLGVWIVAGF